MKRPRMTPQERIRTAKKLFDRAKYQPGLTQAKRADLRRIAHNLVACNMLEARREEINERFAARFGSRKASAT